MKIGFIGIGRMGSNMARYILEGGYDLTVHDLRQEAAAHLLEMGAKWVNTPKDIAETCDVVFSSLPGPEEVQTVVYGIDGLIEGWKTGDIYVDMSTNSHDMVIQIAKDATKKRVAFLDTPVTGGTKGAEEGNLVFIVGGEKAALEKIEDILYTMGKKIYHVGDTGSGTVAKLVNNVISITSNAIMAEAFVLGVKAGVNPQMLYEVAISGTANNWDLEKYPDSVFIGDFEPGFRLSLASKDVGLALQLGRKLGVPLPVAAAVDQSYLAAKAAGFGDKQLYSIFQYLENLVGVQVRTTEK
ncbi:MAG: NAD(P)-dependent oxidoreductase [Dehalococcoidales bacterium]|nr:MAG: NAD(P)-dependent oxidoreductase [Dehalococcoidales bacterium]